MKWGDASWKAKKRCLRCTWFQSRLRDSNSPSLTANLNCEVVIFTRFEFTVKDGCHGSTMTPIFVQWRFLIRLDCPSFSLGLYSSWVFSTSAISYFWRYWGRVFIIFDERNLTGTNLGSAEIELELVRFHPLHETEQHMQLDAWSNLKYEMERMDHRHVKLNSTWNTTPHKIK